MTFNNEIVNVGIDCTDFFPMLRGCAICTGDCDTDSDCDGELRCAHRTRIDGQENVPGCVWGDDSDDLLMSNGDYCEFFYFLTIILWRCLVFLAL